MRRFSDWSLSVYKQVLAIIAPVDDVVNRTRASIRRLRDIMMNVLNLEAVNYKNYGMTPFRNVLENGGDPKSLKDPDSELLRVARLFHDQITPPEDYAFLIDFFSRLVTDIDHRDAEGMTALMWVATSRNKAALKVILDRGAKLDVRSKDGRTALMWAACSRAIGPMKILVAAGANESLRDPTGRTATEWFAWTNASHKATTPPQSKGLLPLGERIVRSRQIALQTYLKQEDKRGHSVILVMDGISPRITVPIQHLFEMGAGR